MSQICTIKTRLVDKTFLSRALQDMGYTVQEGPVKFGFPYGKRAAEIKITTPSGYEVGFRKGAEGYEILTRAGNTDIDQVQFTHQVTQRYAYHVARSKLEEQGFSLVTEKKQPDGQIHLLLRRMA